MLEQHAPAPFHRPALFLARLVHVDAEHLDGAAALRHQTDDGAGQHRLARARRADKAEDLAALHIEIEILEDQAILEADREIAHADDRIVDGVRHRRAYMSMVAKKIANRPSITITKKIDFTTDAVV